MGVHTSSLVSSCVLPNTNAVSVGGMIIGVDGSAECFVDSYNIQYSFFERAVSALHFLAPEATATTAPFIHSFTQLVIAVAKARHGWVNDGNDAQRSQKVNANLLSSFRQVAIAEREMGSFITVCGDKLKMTFDTEDDVRQALGEIQTAGHYGAGTPFSLTAPYEILWNPTNGDCWVRCGAEVVSLASGLNYVGAADNHAPGFVPLHAVANNNQ